MIPNWASSCSSRWLKASHGQITVISVKERMRNGFWSSTSWISIVWTERLIYWENIKMWDKKEKWDSIWKLNESRSSLNVILLPVWTRSLYFLLCLLSLWTWLWLLQWWDWCENSFWLRGFSCSYKLPVTKLWYPWRCAVLNQMLNDLV